MADVFTHVLAAYVVATLCSFRYDWLTPPYVTVCTMGALIPDMNKIGHLVSSGAMESWLGVPFSWEALHTLGGSLVAVLVGTFLVPPAYRVRVFSLLVLGMATHHVLDVLIAHPAGYGYDLFWPLSETWVPVAGFYHSSDRWPLLLVGSVAALVHLGRYRFDSIRASS